MDRSPLNGEVRAHGAWKAFALSAVVALLALLPAILPFGGRFVTRGDYLEQQIPFILETRRVLLSGEPFWSWNTFLGANFVGSYSFYTLGSPFVWPLVLLPEAAVPYGISVMAVLKHAVCGLTAFLYLRRMVREERAALAGALLYAFSSFTAVNTQFYHFTEVVAFFPLILLGMEDAFSARRHHGALAAACALNALCNYYFMAGTAIFAAMYFVFRWFSPDWRVERRLRRAVGVVLECALGCLMASVLLVPSAWSLLSVTRANGAQTGALYGLADILERLRVLLMPIESSALHALYGGAATWSSVAAYLPLTGVALAALYCLRRGGGWLKALLAALLAVSLVPVLNAAFTLGSNALYTRWWYALVLMLALASAYVLARPDARDRLLRPLAGACLALALLLTLPCLLPQDLLSAWVDGEGLLAGCASFLLAQRSTGAYAPDAFRALALGLTALNYGMLLALGGRRLRTRMFVAALCAAAVVNYASFIALNDRLVLSSGAQANAGEIPLEDIAQAELLDERPAHEGTAYCSRIHRRTMARNYGMIVNEPSITSFHSLRSGYLSDFVYLGGFGYDESTTVRLSDDGGALRSFLSVRYYYNFDQEREPGAPEGFVYSHTVGDVDVYVNENYVPMGFLYDTYTDVYDQELNPETIGEVMLKAVVLRGTQIGGVSGMTPYRLSEQPERSWQEAAAELRENACDSFVATPGGFTAHIDARRSGILCFTVPFDKGWSATMDGEPVDIVNVNLGFMGLPVFEGEHVIEFTYRVRGLALGAALSAGATAVWAVYAMVCARRRARG